jgi:hypothetical protein
MVAIKAESQRLLAEAKLMVAQASLIRTEALQRDHPAAEGRGTHVRASGLRAPKVPTRSMSICSRICQCIMRHLASLRPPGWEPEPRYPDRPA